MELEKMLKQELLSEEGFAIGVINMPSYNDLLNRKDRKKLLDYFKKHWLRAKEESGFETLKEYIQYELNKPRTKKVFNEVLKTKEDIDDFWKRVDYISSTL